SRLRWDPRTQAYLKRRISEGKTRREVIRCLKRSPVVVGFVSLPGKHEDGRPICDPSRDVATTARPQSGQVIINRSWSVVGLARSAAAQLLVRV
ncbi:hypothetical protein ACWEP4_41835, partial [Streptomyces sp. NPDC004227]